MRSLTAGTHSDHLNAHASVDGSKSGTRAGDNSKFTSLIGQNDCRSMAAGGMDFVC